jgi:hypothetical protein
MSTPVQPPYNFPLTTYHTAYGQYSRVVNVTQTVNNPFTATGSFSNPIGVSTNDNVATALIYFKGGGNITTADMAPGVIYPFQVSYVSGTFTNGKHIHVYY